MGAKNRLILRAVLAILIPWFIPGARDLIFQLDRQTQATAVVRGHVYAAADAATPASIGLMAYIRELRDRGARVVIDGREVSTPPEGVPPPDDFSLRVEHCTLDAEMVEAVLREYNSPAAGQGLGEKSVSECRRTKVDNAYWLAMFIWESGAGSNPEWAGNKGGGEYTGNTGNIICAGFSPCYGRFRDYDGRWGWGTQEHFDLLRCYRDGGGSACGGLWTGQKHATIVEALTTWAPPKENNINAYTDFVLSTVREWRTLRAGTFVADGPKGEPQQAAPSEAPVDAAEKSISFDSGPFGQNVRSVINSSPDLQRVSIPPGGSFSFNERWHINGDGQLTTYVVYGGGACNVAGVYSYLSRRLGLSPSFVHHGVQLAELPWEDAVAIWSSGQRGGQDLIIENTSGRTLNFEARLDDGKLTVRGWLS